MSGSEDDEEGAIPNCRRSQFEVFATASGVAHDAAALERLVRLLQAILPRGRRGVAVARKAAQPGGGKALSRSTYASQRASSSVRSIGMSASPDA